jgi:hypothetical protein
MYYDVFLAETSFRKPTSVKKFGLCADSKLHTNPRDGGRGGLSASYISELASIREKTLTCTLITHKAYIPPAKIFISI